jgi:hypothetical protein
MPIIHFFNVLEGDCNIIQHDSGRLTVIDIRVLIMTLIPKKRKKLKLPKKEKKDV